MSELYSGKQYQFYQAALEAVNNDDTIGPIRKLALRRRLQRPKFLELAMSEYEADIQWDDPDRPCEIDWSDIDWAALLNILLTLLKLFA